MSAPPIPDGEPRALAPVPLDAAAGARAPSRCGRARWTRAPYLVPLIAVLTRGILPRSCRFASEDAYITYRYARNPRWAQAGVQPRRARHGVHLAAVDGVERAGLAAHA
jgi:hypothetical protein